MSNDLGRLGRDVVGRRRELEIVVAALRADRHIVLEGPPGTGKSTLLRAVARAVGVGFEFVEGNAELTPARLVGHFDPARVLTDGYSPDVFEDGPLTSALRDGSLLYVEEINRIPEETLNVLITAIGVSLLLEYSGQVFFGAAPRTFPAILPSANFTLGGLVLSSNQLVVIVVAVLLMIGLELIVHRTKIGMAMRAVSLNPRAAQLVGVNNDVVISFTFGLGSALAAAGGVLYALNYPSIDPLMGVMPGLKAFVAAILGGIGNIPGAALGGLLLGVVETFVNGSQWSTYKDAIAFAILIVILLFRPAGLLGRATVEKV